MLRSALRILAPFLVLAAANIGTAQTSPPELKTLQDVGNFMQTYYLHPQPEFIPHLIEALYPSGYMQKPTNPATVVAFFSEIFAANPNRLSEWLALSTKQDDTTNKALDMALSTTKTGGVLTLGGCSPELNDMYWAAFFASGNPKFVYKLVDQLRYFDERDAKFLFFSGATAMWSLASVAQTQPAVRSAIEQAKTKADKRTQELISELLVRNPETIKQETREIFNNQKDAGKWK